MIKRINGETITLRISACVGNYIVDKKEKIIYNIRAKKWLNQEHKEEVNHVRKYQSA
jgi:hypothetical protein